MPLPPRLELARIEAARDVIDPVFLHSPQYACEPLGAAFGLRLVLKIETQNPIRSFKGRGAELFVARDAADGPMVCASAGNFGQAMAYACRSRERPLTVFASEHANPLKLDRMRALGADVHLSGADFDSAKEVARHYAFERGWCYVEDGHEAAIAEGAGTLALELLQARPDLDALFVPLGNGALLAGVGTVARALRSGAQLIAVAAAGAPAMIASLSEGRLVTTASVDTIADGVAVRVPVPMALVDLDGIVDHTILVEDEAIVVAMRALHEHAGLVVEPAGAVGLAGVMRRAADWRGARVATIVCGGNVTAAQRRRWLA